MNSSKKQTKNGKNILRALRIFFFTFILNIQNLRHTLWKVQANKVVDCNRNFFHFSRLLVTLHTAATITAPTSAHWSGWPISIQKIAAHKSRPCAFGQPLGQPIVRSISHFFWSTKEKIFQYQIFFVHPLEFFVQSLLKLWF